MQLVSSIFEINEQLPLHSISLGSGSQSPLSMHVDSLGPMSVCPFRQLNEALVLTRVRSVSRVALKLSSIIDSCRGGMHLTVFAGKNRHVKSSVTSALCPYKTYHNSA